MLYETVAPYAVQFTCPIQYIGIILYILYIYVGMINVVQYVYNVTINKHKHTLTVTHLRSKIETLRRLRYLTILHNNYIELTEIPHNTTQQLHRVDRDLTILHNNYIELTEISHNTTQQLHRVD